jgi:hypothetical protein
MLALEMTDGTDSAEISLDVVLVETTTILESR